MIKTGRSPFVALENNTTVHLPPTSVAAAARMAALRARDRNKPNTCRLIDLLAPTGPIDAPELRIDVGPFIK